MISISIDDKRLEKAITAEREKFNAENIEAPIESDELFAQNALTAVAAHYASVHRVGVIQPGNFLLRFTSDELSALKAAAESDVAIDGFMNRIKEAQEVWLYSGEVQDGIAYCVANGYLTQARADEVLDF